MIKGVSKLIIEINNTENAYFEKAILFLRDSSAEADNNDIQQNARAFLRGMTPSGRRKHRIPTGLLIAGAAGAGAAVMGVAAMLIR